MTLRFGHCYDAPCSLAARGTRLAVDIARKARLESGQIGAWWSDRDLRPSGVAAGAITGVIAALVAAVLIVLTRFIVDTFGSVRADGPLVVAAPVLAGVIAGIFRYRFSAGSTGLESIAAGRASDLGTALRTAGLAVVTASLGGFVGREEPAIGLAGAVTQRAGLLQRSISPRGLLAATVAGGIGTTAGAPFAALAFALEAVAGRFAATDLIAVAVAAFGGALIGRFIGPAASVPVGVAPDDVIGWIGLAAVAVVGLLLSLGVSSLLGAVGDFSRRYPIATVLAPIGGGILVGGLLVVAPAIADPVAAEPAASGLAVAIGKTVATAALLATGGGGGLIVPILAIGTAAGSGVVALAEPFIGTVPGTTVAMVLAVALVAGAFRTPLAAVALAAESGSDPLLIGPLAVLCWAGAAFCRRVDPLSILTVIRPEPPAAPASDSVRQLATLRVGDVMDTNVPSISASASIDTVRRLAAPVPVVDRLGRLIGIAGPDDAERALLDGQRQTAAGFARRHGPVAHPYQTIAEAFDQPGAELATMLPVVDPRQQRQLIGVIHRSSALAAAGIPPSEAPDILGPFHLPIGDGWAGHRLRDLKLPKESFAAAIDRAGHRQPARPEMVLRAGDTLIGLTLPSLRTEVEFRLRNGPTA